MKACALLAVLAVSLTLPTRAGAQQVVRLQMQNGLVTLDAQNVSVRQILAEWARVGGAKIINGEKVMGGPVTLQLNGVSERQALDTILRAVSGYMLVPRQVAASGVSRFDRILIMPTSSAPRGNASPGNTGVFSPRPMPAPAPEPVETVAEDDDSDAPEGDPDVAEEGEDEAVQPPPGAIGPPMQRRPPFPNPMGPQGQPVIPQGVFPGPQPQPVDSDEETPPGQTGTGPLNVPPGASSTPGVISPVPQQDPQQQQPMPRPRRPPR